LRFGGAEEAQLPNLAELNLAQTIDIAELGAVEIYLNHPRAGVVDADRAARVEPGGP
jgi:hypothetical protein